MKKTAILTSIISLSLLFSTSSFAKTDYKKTKKSAAFTKHQQSKRKPGSYVGGVVRTTGNAAGNTVETAGKSASNILKSVF